MGSTELWWDEDDPRPDWVIDAPFPSVAVGFGLEKASVTIVGRNFRFYVEGLDTDEPHIGYLQVRRENRRGCWRVGPALSAISFGRPNGNVGRIVWQSGPIAILRISDRNNVFLQFEIARVHLGPERIEFETRSAHNDFASAFASAFNQPWSTGEKE